MKPKKLKIWTNADLMDEFLELNNRYFDGKLPVPLVLAFRNMEELGHTFRFRTLGKRRTKDDDFGIHISRKLRFSQRLFVCTLIHEMVHLQLRNRYSCGPRGKRFNGRMRQLAFLGAFDGLW